MRYKKSLLLLSVLSAAVLLLSRCETHEITANDPRGPKFAGAAQCRQCHAAIYDAYVASTHFNTTSDSTKTVQEGVFVFDDSSTVMVHRTDSGWYQSKSPYMDPRRSTINLPEQHRMDIAFGLKHAQTFLYWKDNRPFELPVSYYMQQKQWGTSPGFSAKHPDFNRFIGANCFECHSSYIGSQLNASTAGIEEVLDKDKLVYGIDCERCHGPALDHINQKKPMLKISSFSRQQKLDVCAVCHSGNNKIQERSTFAFRPGDTLSKYFVVWPSKDTDTNFDVHGNQYQLLSQSKCFTASKIMDCSTCHDPHKNAGTDLKIYSNVCMSCHKTVEHSFAKQEQLVNDCINCHMPNQLSKAITFQLAATAPKQAYMLRTHKIAVYKTGN